MSFFSKLFSGTSLTAYRAAVEQMALLEKEYEGRTQEKLRAEIVRLREKARNESEQSQGILEDVRNRAFALARESARRTLHQRHFDAQLLGGLALFDGKIAEMATGEGKTLAATAPALARALMRPLHSGGVHIITVNDYLALRDAVWMGQIYDYLGLRVACLVHDASYVYDGSFLGSNDKNTDQALDEKRDETGSFRVQRDFLRPVARKEAYQADIVYGTNHEFGFDYLRDNLAYATTQQVQGGRGHYFAIIDEVDSILIDEARTPLIISAPDAESAQFYKVFAHVVRDLLVDIDYTVDEKAHTVSITESGIEKVEKVLRIDNLYGPTYVRLVHYLEESLKAKALFHRDKQYVVFSGKGKDPEIVIVDEFTGRLMHGRRYSGGLHQAIEAKEGVRVQQESKTYAQITIQNYFRLYEKISGMTGTAYTSVEEFQKVYGLEVVQVPTHKPRIRQDLPDLIYKTKDKKYGAIISQVKSSVEKGQPVLVGTTSIDENELLSSLFSNAGVVHEVLNAKNHEREGEIISQAGRPGKVMLATNMAGRGVDIVLGGNPPDSLEMDRVGKAGGLFVLGTQRNEARRIDNQLRGRSGRQGDPGQTQFFLSLEDDMLRIFGGDRIKSLMTNLKLPEDAPIESSLVNRVIDEAQKKVEGLNFDARKHLLDYDDVLNKQRTAVYRKRQNMLEKLEQGKGEELLCAMVLGFCEKRMIVPQDASFDEESKMPSLDTELKRIQLLGDADVLSKADEQKLESGEIPDLLQEKIKLKLTDPQTSLRMIASLDIFWTNHLENLEALLESVRIRAYAQKDPLVEYKRESFDMFKTLLSDAEEWVVSNVFVDQTKIKQVPKSVMHENISESGSVPTRHDVNPNTGEKIGRNDPCWCNSGKKYKKCHGT